MPALHVHGTDLDYTDRGTGAPLVLVHGSGSDRRTWRHQEETFAARFRVLSYSRRYHWPNAPIPDGAVYEMDVHVRDLEAVLRARDAAPAHLVGHSYGGFLCLLLALRAPALVRTLVLAEPPVVTLFVSDPPKPWELVRLLLTRPRTAAAILRFGVQGAAPAVRAFERGDAEAGIRAFGKAVLGPGGFDRLPEARKAQVRDNVTNVEAELLGPGLAPLEADGVRQVRAPVLLVTGAQSAGLFGRLTDGLEALLPRAERVEIPGTGHMMHEEAPDAFNAAVLAFVERYGDAA